MNDIDKILLIKDLCARLPYGVKAKCGREIAVVKAIGRLQSSSDNIAYEVNNDYSIEYVKPYLFPLSSMTEEQKKEIANIDKHGNIYFKISKEYHIDDSIQIDIKDISKYLGWLNKNHFDYHGLIDKGLAIDATNLNIY